ncbi:ABC transporter ATP-binding protein [Nesterenkonia xinjiangensis]|uniref:ABC-type quaternary amine transporter n=1 Tax=Nesterenkonia xinjiangensis TaxID=225327 RepID=A0A7Z0GNR2_9MICC|nr:ABC transporter ATP-binding protein [Nesterenkonia xinjiangensis]NYJ79380.1 iron(III) transport system ATP-binding protein [Nesterenkonia xinjiangensis]
MSTVNFDSVDVTFADGHQALRSVSLDIADGEFIALVGPSGSGKTTLLRSLAGFISPSAGTISIDGAPVSAPESLVAVEHRGLGMVFQQHALWPHMKVGENIAYPLKLAGVRRPRRERRVAEVLDLVGLAGMGGRRPDQLSGGQRQRVALARAIIHQPRVLLLDEALSALDEPLRATLRSQLQSMAKDLGLTVLHVTHDRSEALAIADRIVVLDQGRILQAGRPAEVVAQPATGFVAQFLNDATLLNGVLDSHGFHADGLPLMVPRRNVSTDLPEGEPSVPGQLAVTPNHVVLSPVGPEETGGADVVSSLYGRHAHTVELHWSGRRMRGETAGWQPAPGDLVGVDVIGGLFFPEGPLPPMHRPHRSESSRPPAPPRSARTASGG